MSLFEFALFAFTSLFTVINPVGVLPVFLSMTQDLPNSDIRRIAAKATLTAFIAMVFFALSGQFIFNFFAISINGLKIVGGIMFFLLGYEMLQGKMSRTKSDSSLPEIDSEFAITPLGIPMLCGPGTITASIVLMQDNAALDKRIVLLAAMAAVCGATLLLLVGARTIVKLIGSSANRVLTRVMGLIVMMIAVEFFVAGLKPIVREILAR